MGAATELLGFGLAKALLDAVAVACLMASSNKSTGRGRVVGAWGERAQASSSCSESVGVTNPGGRFFWRRNASPSVLYGSPALELAADPAALPGRKGGVSARVIVGADLAKSCDDE